jgi:hypothetical protein
MKRARILALLLTLACAAPSLAQGRGRGPGGSGPLDLLRVPEVQQELKLSQAQIELLGQVRQQMGEKMRDLFQQGGERRGGSPQDRQRRMAEFQKLRESYDKQALEILDHKQAARLKQLRIQRRGIRALGDKDVQDDLRLSGDQRSRIESTLQAERDDFRSAFDGVRPGSNMTNEQRDEIRRKIEEVRSGTAAKLNAILTDGQKRQFQSMQGAPFRFPERGPRGGRGRPNQIRT